MLGSGATGSFFRAVDERGRDAIIKRFHVSARPEDVDAEVENITRIWCDCSDCPYLVRFLHVALDPGDAKFRKGPALVLEYCSAGSLEQFIEARQASGQPFLTEFELWTVALHLTSGLAELHKRKLVHRDIAPRNVFISHNEKGELVFKIGDVGVCKRVQDDKTFVVPLQNSLPDAPEFIRADFTADVFSLGLVLYELAALKLVDLVAEAGELQRERQAVRTELIETPDLSKRYGKLRNVMLKMMAESPATRHTAAQAVHMLSLLKPEQQVSNPAQRFAPVFLSCPS